MATVHWSAEFVTNDSTIPPLQSGDRLTRAEFERRYEAMPNLRKAELVEGVVIVASPVSSDHAVPHAQLVTWFGLYVAHTSGLQAGDNCTVRLDKENEVQPDVFVRVLPEFGGQSVQSGKYIGGAPELLAEVASTSASYDLHDKLKAYCRNQVREYIVWRVFDRELDWFVWRDGVYERHVPDQDGLYRSQHFPGLWLNATALLAGDMARVLQDLQNGLRAPEHQDFVQQLQRARKS